jgi:hypothetical protein
MLDFGCKTNKKFFKMQLLGYFSRYVTVFWGRRGTIGGY